MLGSARFVVAVGFALLAAACASDKHPREGNAAGGPRDDSPAIVVEPIGPPPPAPLGRPMRVLVAGDLLPHRPSLVQPAAIRSALAPLAPMFAKADAVVANYEAATGDVDAKSFRLAYAAPHGWLEELPRAGIGALTVANNHACDLGLEGLEATLDAAAKSDVVALGGDPKDPWAAKPIVEKGGKRICAVAWTTLMNAESGCARSVRLAIARTDRKGTAMIDTAIARAKTWCDATVAMIHGGEEYVAQRREVMEQARHAAEAGADVVVIHHPHVASPVEVVTTRDGRKVPLFASVGNLVSNQGESWKPTMFPVLRENRRLVCVNGWTRLGVIADLAFDFGKDAIALDWGFHLTWTENEHADNKNAAVPKIETRLLDPEKDAEIVSKLNEDERGPVDLFDDPCWLDKPMLTADDATRDPRCSSSIVHRPAPVLAFDTKTARGHKAGHVATEGPDPRRKARPRRP